MRGEQIFLEGGGLHPPPPHSPPPDPPLYLWCQTKKNQQNKHTKHATIPRLVYYDPVRILKFYDCPSLNFTRMPSGGSR